MRSFSDDEIACIAARARVLGDPARVRILNALAQGEHPAERLAALLGVDTSSLLDHLQVLFNVGLVQRRRQANGTTYAIETADLIGVCDVLGRCGWAPGEKERRLG